MSFGFMDSNLKIDKALEKAVDHGIVVFAAASNSAGLEEIAWPARDPARAICVHSSNDGGKRDSDFTPLPDKNIINFMVVGERVCSHWPVSKGGGFRTMSGTSTATPVAVAIAALLLAFIRQGVVDKKTKDEVEDDIGVVRLQELLSMRTLLKHICAEASNYYCLSPNLLWKTCRQDEDPRAASGHAWEEIRKALRA